MPNIVVKYQTQKHYCSCCDQKLPEPKTSKEKEFEISKENALQWANWSAAARYQEDIERMVPEFVYETIRFWAVDSDVKVIIEDSQIEKVNSWILSEVVEQVTDLIVGYSIFKVNDDYIVAETQEQAVTHHMEAVGPNWYAEGEEPEVEVIPHERHGRFETETGWEEKTFGEWLADFDYNGPQLICWNE